MPEPTIAPPVPPAPPAPPAPPTQPNLDGLSYQELAKVADQWLEMSRSWQAQADRIETGASRIADRLPELASQFRDTSRQWHEQALSTKAQADQILAKAREARTNSHADLKWLPSGSESYAITEKDGHIVVKQGDNVVVDVPSKNRDRSSRSNGSSNGDEYLAVPIVFIVFLFLFLIVKAIMGPIHQRRRADGSSAAAGPGLSAADSATLQKIHRTLGQMERRVEALETILADPRRTAAFTTVTRPSTAAPNPSTPHESKV